MGETPCGLISTRQRQRVSPQNRAHCWSTIIRQGRALTPLEQGGVLHALQILIENAIGKAKQWLKAGGQPVPVSGYDAFAALARQGWIAPADLPSWNAVIGLRNRIVHDYMNIDMKQIITLIERNDEQLIVHFLQQEIHL